MRRHMFFEIQFQNFDSIRYLVSILYRPLFVLNIFISPYFDIASHKIGSFTSGGKPANLTRLTPMPANSTFTMDISPLSCFYSCCPCMFWRIDCSLSAETNFIYTLLRGPSICIIRISSSCRRNFAYIHSCILKAVILGLLMSKMQNIIFCRSPISMWCCRKCNSLNFT